MLAITGANGHLGLRLLRDLETEVPVRALVRSQRALDQVTPPCRARGGETRQVDYADVDAMAEALAGCRQVVHLVGIIRETRTSRYHDAHERSCAVLAAATARAGVAHIVYLSLFGAVPDAANPCLASRGAAEALLLAGAVPATVIRVPMVLGEHDHASAALRRRASRRFPLLLRGASLEQPIYAGDVVDAIRGALQPRSGMPSVPQSALLELAGPESLSRRALTARAAAILGRRSDPVPLPAGLALLAVGMLERLLAEPPVTRAMLGVLDHDDAIDPGPAARALDVTLTPLDATLRRVLLEGC